MASNLPNGAQVVGLPFSNDVPWYRFQITLAGTNYNLRMKYNSRMNRWVFDIGNDQNADILTGMPALVDRSLTKQFIGQPNVPAGIFFVRNLTAGDQSQPTRYSFGVTHTGFYYDPTGTT